MFRVTWSEILSWSGKVGLFEHRICTVGIRAQWNDVEPVLGFQLVHLLNIDHQDVGENMHAVDAQDDE